jgi:hypothetical protein
MGFETSEASSRGGLEGLPETDTVHNLDMLSFQKMAEVEIRGYWWAPRSGAHDVREGPTR